jgi:transposase
MYKNNSRYSSKVKGCSPLQLSCNLTGKFHAIGYYSYTKRYLQEGVNDATIMTIISEVGLEGIKKFDSAKQFTAWLRLSPNNKISGGKVLSHHIPKGSSRLKIALRNAANAIGNLKEGHLADFFRRINYKKGRTTAINATARKLAVIIWNMLVKTQNYNPPSQYLFLDEKRRLGLVKRIRKQINKFEIQPEQLGFANT